VAPGACIPWPHPVCVAAHGTPRSPVFSPSRRCLRESHPSSPLIVNDNCNGGACGLPTMYQYFATDAEARWVCPEAPPAEQCRLDTSIVHRLVPTAMLHRHCSTVHTPLFGHHPCVHCSSPFSLVVPTHAHPATANLQNCGHQPKCPTWKHGRVLQRHGLRAHRSWILELPA
jgi:hypothetical protein